MTVAIAQVRSSGSRMERKRDRFVKIKGKTNLKVYDLNHKVPYLDTYFKKRRMK